MAIKEFYFPKEEHKYVLHVEHAGDEPRVHVYNDEAKARKDYGIHAAGVKEHGGHVTLATHSVNRGKMFGIGKVLSHTYGESYDHFEDPNIFTVPGRGREIETNPHAVVNNDESMPEYE